MSDSLVISPHFTVKIVLGMVLGAAFGFFLSWSPIVEFAHNFFVLSILHAGGKIFIHLIMMLVVPVVFLSLVCGSSSLGDVARLGRMGGKTIGLYLFTTALAISLALFIAAFFHVGSGIPVDTAFHAVKKEHMIFHDVLVDMFPKNPIKAMAEGNMLQVIVFAVLLGIALASFKEKAKRATEIFHELNQVFMKLIVMIMKLAPYGVFCLLAALTEKVGLSIIQELIGYFFVVLLVLLLQLCFVYPSMLSLISGLSPLRFLIKMRNAMLFAFGVSSSNASIPFVLSVVEKRLGVSNGIASFIIPLGATINMDGTAIMQGVATIFIANAYHVQLGIAGYLMVVGMATLASIGTAGVPGVGMITLAMVLEQVGLPTQGIGMIIAVDRLLDMARTAVNVSGDAMIACIVGKSEKEFSETIFKDKKK